MDFYSHAVHQAGDTKLKDLQQQYDTLKDQHERLKKHFASLTETVHVLGDQSVQTTRIAQQTQNLKSDMLSQNAKLQQQLKQAQEAHTDLNNRYNRLQEHFKQTQGSKLDLLNTHTKQKEQLKALKETVEALNNSYEAAGEKLLLQNQLHSDQLRTIEATHKKLKERCTALATSAEQHRIANLKLEEKHKSLNKDMETLAALHVKDLKIKEGEIKSLKSKVDSHAIESKRLQSKLHVAETLLKAHPVDAKQTAKAKNILSSSAEVLQLAHDSGSHESMRQCLKEVAEALHGLGGQMDSQHRLASAWLEQLGGGLEGSV